MISITINHTMNLIPKYLTAISEAGRKAAVHAINRSAQGVRTEGSRWISQRINLPIGGRTSKGGGGRTPPGIKSLIDITRAKYRKNMRLRDTFALVHASNKPISLIHFVKGSKEPRSQKGIKITDRKVLKAMVMKGRAASLPKAFIARSNRGGAVQVFRRKSQGSYHKQVVPALSHWMTRPEFKRAMRGIAIKRLSLEYPRQLSYWTNQIPKRR